MMPVSDTNPVRVAIPCRARTKSPWAAVITATREAPSPVNSSMLGLFKSGTTRVSQALMATIARSTGIAL